MNNAVRVNCVLGCGSSVAFGGDLGGSISSQTVIGLEGRPLAATAPAPNQILTWSGTAWAPATPTSGAGTGSCSTNQFVTGVNLGSSPNCIQPAFSSLSGIATSNQLPAASSSAQGAVELTQDLAGSTLAPKVAGLQGNPVSSAAPTSNQVLTWNGTAWAPANVPATGAQIAQDLGGTTLAPKVVGLQGNAVSSITPTGGQCLTYNGSQWAPGTCASGAGVPGGSTSQIQFNNSGSLAGATNFTYSTATGGVSIQPAPGQNVVPFTLAPAVPSPSTDIFDVFKDSGKTTKSIWVDYSGNFNSNTAVFGQANQASPSYLKLYGGPATPGYLQLLNNSGSLGTYIFGSGTTAGIACASTS